MPLSRFTQTWPLDFAAATWLSEAAPVGAVLAAFGAAEVEGAIAFDDVEAGALEVLAGAAAGAAAGAELEAALESLAADFFERLFFVGAALESVAAVEDPAAGAAAGAEPEAALESLAADFFEWLFLLGVADASPLAGAADPAADESAASALFLLFFFEEVVAVSLEAAVDPEAD